MITQKLIKAFSYFWYSYRFHILLQNILYECILLTGEINFKRRWTLDIYLKAGHEIRNQNFDNKISKLADDSEDDNTKTSKKR